MSGTTSQTPQQKAAAQNAAARVNVFRGAKPIMQVVTSKTITNVASGNNVITVNPLQIGFLRRFLIDVQCTIANGDTGQALTLTPNGADNIIKNVQFNDFTGNPRHNCSGRSLSFVEAMKYQRIPGAAATTDSVSGFGSNVASNVAPLIAASSSGTLRRVFELPIMVDMGYNMAGGMWLGVNNQSTLLQITLNEAPIGLPTADPLNLVYRLASGGTTVNSTPITSATVTVYQEYWTNIGGAPASLPQMDLSTAYMINESNSGLNLAAGNSSYWNYPTFSKLLGTYVVFDNGAVMNPGTDLTWLNLVVSNYSYIKQFSPYVLDRIVRDICGASFPDGCYAIPSRQHPLDVSQYPSLQLQVEPSSVGSSPVIMITTELLRPVQFMGVASGVGGT